MGKITEFLIINRCESLAREKMKSRDTFGKSFPLSTEKSSGIHTGAAYGQRLTMHYSKLMRLLS